MSLHLTGGLDAGRRLKSPAPRLARPTTALLRQAVFNTLGRRVGDARVLDLFAGAGTMGLEALSRGARHCTFVDSSGACASIVRENLRLAGHTEEAAVFCSDACSWLRQHGSELVDFDLVFLDPPYASPLTPEALGTLEGHLRPEALVVLEHGRSELGAPVGAGWVIWRRKRYGDSCVTYLEPAGQS